MQPYPEDICWQKASVALCFHGIEQVRQVCAGGCECEQTSCFGTVTFLLARLPKDNAIDVQVKHLHTFH